MWTTVRVLAAAIGLAVVGVWLGACAAGPEARGPRPDLGAQFRRGELHAPMDATPGEVAAAARRALEGLEITVLDVEATEVSGQTVGRTARGERVVVTAVREVAGPSQVTIRVGALGDEAVSRAIYQRMLAMW